MQQTASSVSVVTMTSHRKLRGFTVSSFHSVSANPPLIGFNLFRHAAFHRFLLSPSLPRPIRFTVNILSDSDATLAQHFAKGHHPSLKDAITPHIQSHHSNRSVQSDGSDSRDVHLSKDHTLQDLSVGRDANVDLNQDLNQDLNLDGDLDRSQFHGIPIVIDADTKAPIIKSALAVLSCEVLWTKTAADHEVVVATVIGVPSVKDGKPLVYYGRKYHSLHEILQ